MTWEVRQGDVRDCLREMPDESVQCVVTSPPYWGLRDYGIDGQLGLEPTPEQYVANMIEVFREVRRVLRSDGTVWLNLGDSYAGGAAASGGVQRLGPNGDLDNQRNDVRLVKRGDGLKPKDLIGIPWMVAFALRADGWYLRRDIIWSKPNPMPESVTDRPTSAHEYVFLLTKSARYFYDADAIREQAQDWGERDRRGPLYDGTVGPQSGHNGLRDLNYAASGRNRRSVWEIATQPYPEAHFATFPTKLVEPCILAGSSSKACGECGAPWKASTGARMLDLSRPQARRAQELADDAGLTAEHIEAIRSCGVADSGKAQVTQDGFGKNDGQVQALADEAKDVLGGYYREFLLARPERGELRPTCDHEDDLGRSIVLDPFAGSGTVGVVALRHDRGFVGIELNKGYCELARRRIEDDAPLLNSVFASPPPTPTREER